MNLADRFKKIWSKISLIKNLIVFALNLCTVVPPFSQVYKLLKKLQEKINKIESMFEEIGKSPSSVNFLFQIYKEAFCVVFGLIFIAFYLRNVRKNLQNP